MGSTRIITFVLFIVNSLLFAQQKIDITITENTPTYCVVSLNNYEPILITGLVFTIKSKSLLFDNGELLSSHKYTIGNYNYQTFYLFDQFITNPVFKLTKIGDGKFTIISEGHPSLNNAYFISVGGLDVTGQVIGYNDITDNYIMYYDPNSNQFVFKNNNGWVTILGQNINVDTTLFLRTR